MLVITNFHKMGTGYQEDILNIIIAILIFSLIIIIHELGHFLLAKKNGIFVKEFSIGMGPRIITLVKSKKGYRLIYFLSGRDFETDSEWKDITKYSWKLLPIGGSCMMLGEDESLEDERAFNKKGVWARISVIFAGPLFNFILAFLLTIVVISINGYNTGYSPATVKSVVNHSSAKDTANLKPGDIITNINGTDIDTGYEFETYLQTHPLNGEKLRLTYTRDGGSKHNTFIIPTRAYKLGFDYQSADSTGIVIKVLSKNMPIEAAGFHIGDIILKINDNEIENEKQMEMYFTENPLSKSPVLITYSRAGQVKKTVKITPALSKDYAPGFNIYTGRQKTNAFGLIKYSVVQVKYMIVTTVQSLGQLIRGRLGLNDMVGPVGVVNLIGNVYNANKSDGLLNIFMSMANMAILLSANLGVMNLLPFPALDGGRLVFLFLEVYRKKPINQEKEGLIHIVGLVTLLVLMVVIMFNDVRRLI